LQKKEIKDIIRSLIKEIKANNKMLIHSFLALITTEENMQGVRVEN